MEVLCEDCLEAEGVVGDRGQGGRCVGEGSVVGEGLTDGSQGGRWR